MLSVVWYFSDVGIQQDWLSWRQYNMSRWGIHVYLWYDTSMI